MCLLVLFSFLIRWHFISGHKRNINCVSYWVCSEIWENGHVVWCRHHHNPRNNFVWLVFAINQLILEMSMQFNFIQVKRWCSMWVCVSLYLTRLSSIIFTVFTSFSVCIMSNKTNYSETKPNLFVSAFVKDTFAYELRDFGSYRKVAYIDFIQFFYFIYFMYITKGY